MTSTDPTPVGPPRQRPQPITSPSHPLLDRPPTPDMTSVAWFVVLVIGLAWLQAIAPLLQHYDVQPPAWLSPADAYLGGGMAPLWSMLIVGGLTMGWPALRCLLRHSLRVKVHVGLYLAAVIIPFALSFVAGALTGTPAVPLDAEPAALLSRVLLLAPVFVLAENLGWRAWLQRGLQARVSPPTAGGLVGLVICLHHLPLFHPDSGTIHAELPFAGFAAMWVVASVLLAVLFTAARGSVMPVGVAHVSFNLAVQLFVSEQPSDATPFFLMVALLGAILAVAVGWRAHTNARRDQPASP